MGPLYFHMAWKDVKLYSLPISKQFRYTPAEQQENHLLKQVPAADLAAPFLGIIDAVPADVGVISQDDIESEEEDFELRALRNISIRNRAIREYQRLIASATPLQQWRIIGMLHDMMSPQQRRELFGPERWGGRWTTWQLKQDLSLACPDAVKAEPTYIHTIFCALALSKSGYRPNVAAGCDVNCLKFFDRL